GVPLSDALVPYTPLVRSDPEGVTIDDERVPSRTVVWAAGVTASTLAARLGELTNAERDRAGRITVEPDLTLPGHPEVFALGDMRSEEHTSELQSPDHRVC